MNIFILTTPKFISSSLLFPKHPTQIFNCKLRVFTRQSKITCPKAYPISINGYHHLSSEKLWIHPLCFHLLTSQHPIQRYIYVSEIYAKSNSRTISIVGTLVQFITISHLDYAINSQLVMRFCHLFRQSIRTTDLTGKEKVNLTPCTFNETILLLEMTTLFLSFLLLFILSFSMCITLPLSNSLSFSLPLSNFLFL